MAAGVRDAIAEALERAGIGPADLAACGIASQRDTDFAWDARTGHPLANAITWQDLRTHPPGGFASRLAARGRVPAPPRILAGAVERRPPPRVADAERSGGPRGRPVRLAPRSGPSASWVLAALGGSTDPGPTSRWPRASTCGTSGRATGGTTGWPTSTVPRAALPAVAPTVAEFGHLDLDGTRVPGAGDDRRPAGRALRVRLPARRRRRGHPRNRVVRERLPRRRGAGARHDQGLPRLADRRAGRPTASRRTRP